MKPRTWVILLCSWGLAAPAAGVAADDPDVMEILKRADAATKAVNAVSYEGEFFGLGEMKDRTPHIRGTLKAKLGKQSLMNLVLGGKGGVTQFSSEGVLVPPDSKAEFAFKIATDGRQAYRLNEKDQVFVSGKMPEAKALIEPAYRLFMLEYLHATPFSDEINAKVQRYEGEEEVDGLECHVVYVVYQNNTESRWFFGKRDYLPRRVERVVKRTEDRYDAYVLVVKNLEVDPELDNGLFVLRRPEEYKKEVYDPRKSEPDGLLAVGATAPHFELTTLDGRTVTLESLRGNVVLMDFWATWCTPCKMSLPRLQELHEDFKDRPVKIIGVNCWESGDPVAYLKDKGYTYQVLLKGDKVAYAYRLRGVPTFFVIDPDGKIVHASSGFEPGKEKELAKIIKKHLPSTD